ncbi:hypothetical protein CRG98_046529, partial [Punica granatum]
MQESSRDVPEGFAICTGRIPNEQHGSKAPTQWTCGVRGVLPGGFARCGVFCPGFAWYRKVVGTYPKCGKAEMQESSRDVPEVQESSRDVPETYPKCRKVVGTYPKCRKVVGRYSKCGKVVGTYPKCGKIVGTYPKCGKVVGTYPKCRKVVGTYPKCRK